MPTRSPPSDQPSLRELEQVLTGFFDAEWYLSRYPDVATCGLEPMAHFLQWGAAEGRDPNRLFDSGWYLAALSGRRRLAGSRRCCTT